MFLPNQQRDLGASQHHGLGALRGQVVDDFPISGERFRLENAGAEFFIDHSMDDIACRLGRRDHRKAEALGEPAADDRTVFHGETGAQQSELGPALGRGRFADRIGDMNERDLQRLFDGAGDLMHGVGAQKDAVGAAGLQAAGGIGQHPAHIVPAAFMLSLFDRTEIDAVHQDLRRMQRTQPVAHLAIDDAIIFGAGFPAHAADQSDHLHIAYPPPLR